MNESQATPKEETAPNDLLTVKEATARYRLSKDCLYRLMKTGVLASYTPPFSATKISAADIDSLLRKSKNPACKTLEDIGRRV